MQPDPYTFVISDLKRRHALVCAAIEAIESLRPDLIPRTIIDLGHAAEKTAELALTPEAPRAKFCAIGILFNVFSLLAIPPPSRPEREIG